MARVASNCVSAKKAYYKLEALDKDHLDQWREKLEVALQGQPSGLKLPEPNRLLAPTGIVKMKGWQRARLPAFLWVPRLHPKRLLPACFGRRGCRGHKAPHGGPAPEPADGQRHAPAVAQGAESSCELAWPESIPSRKWDLHGAGSSGFQVDKAFKTPREYVLAHVHTAAYDAGPEVVTMMRLLPAG